MFSIACARSNPVPVPFCSKQFADALGFASISAVKGKTDISGLRSEWDLPIPIKESITGKFLHVNSGNTNSFCRLQNGLKGRVRFQGVAASATAPLLVA